VWSSAEVAISLQGQRGDLLRAVTSRRDARGLPRELLEEIVSEAMCVVVMMRKPITSSEHLEGAFWTAVGLLLRHQREGRRDLRVGSRRRVEFDVVAATAKAEGFGPDEIVELKDRMVRAADLMAHLTELERQVLAVMAVRRVGVKMTARILIMRMKTKWGSCNPDTARLWFNVELAKKHPLCLEYIVVHGADHRR